MGRMQYLKVATDTLGKSICKAWMEADRWPSRQKLQCQMTFRCNSYHLTVSTFGPAMTNVEAGFIPWQGRRRRGKSKGSCPKKR